MGGSLSLCGWMTITQLQDTFGWHFSQLMKANIDVESFPLIWATLEQLNVNKIWRIRKNRSRLSDKEWHERNIDDKREFK